MKRTFPIMRTVYLTDGTRVEALAETLRLETHGVVHYTDSRVGSRVRDQRLYPWGQIRVVDTHRAHKAVMVPA